MSVEKMITVGGATFIQPYRNMVDYHALCADYFIIFMDVYQNFHIFINLKKYNPTIENDVKNWNRGMLFMQYFCTNN